MALQVRIKNRFLPSAPIRTNSCSTLEAFKYANRSTAALLGRNR